MSLNNSELERRVRMSNEDQEEVELVVDNFGGEMRVQIAVDAAKDGSGNQTFPRQHIQFTRQEWDDLVLEVERARQARKIFNLPA